MTESNIPSPTPSAKNEPAKTWLNDSLIIAFLTLWGYVAAYRYEVGYLKYFQIPAEFIEINISNLLSTAVIVLGFLTSGFLIINGLSSTGIFEIDELRKSPIKRQVLKYLLFLLMILFFLAIYPNHQKISLIILGLYSLWEIVWFTCVYNRGSFKDRIELEEKHESPVRNRMISNRLSLMILGLFIALSFLSVMESIGQSSAKNQKIFLRLNDRQSLVVIRVYPDKIIAKPFDPITKVLKDQIRIISSDEISSKKLLLDKQQIAEIMIERSACAKCD